MTKECKHKELKSTVTANEIQDTCVECKEVISTRTRVLSSSIFAIGRKGKTVDVQFFNKDKSPGPTARFEDVPKKKFKKVIEAKSIGTAFHEEIRGKHAFKYLGAK